MKHYNSFETTDKNDKSEQGQALDSQLEVNALHHTGMTGGMSILSANELAPETRAALYRTDRRLLDGHAILDDNTGALAETYARVVLKNEGMPIDQERIPLKDVVNVKTSSAGIDLVGVERGSSGREGVPVIIEVKKRTEVDNLGEDRITQLEPETLDLVRSIQAERSKDLATQLRIEEKLNQAQAAWPQNPERWHDYDEELSQLQMGGVWTRDRWLKILKDPQAVEALRSSGVGDRYLDMGNLRDPYSPEWQAILDRRKVVVITPGREAASLTLTRDAIFRRHADVIGLTVLGL